MLSRAFTEYPFASMSCLGLVLFLAVFAGALLWVARPGSAAVYRMIEVLPLQGGAEQEEESGDE